MHARLATAGTLALLLLQACGGCTDGAGDGNGGTIDTGGAGDGDDTGPVVDPDDNDGDGWTEAEGDCDDDDASINPGATEICDGVDNDCAAETPEDGLITVGGKNFASLQGAVDAAPDGGQVDVCAGTYAANLVISKDLAIHGVAGAPETVLDGQERDAVVRATDGVELELRGLTLTGGVGYLFGDADLDGELDTRGGAVDAWRADHLLLQRCIVDGNAAEWGGGVVGPGDRLDGEDRAEPGFTTVLDTTVSNNSATELGGGLYLVDGRLEDVDVTANLSLYGGGVAVIRGLVDSDPDTLLMDNIATDGGGGLILWDGAGWSGGTVLANAAERSDEGGAGVYVYLDGSLEDVLVADNVARGSGGGLMAWGGTVTLAGVELVDNDAANGGGAFAYDSDLLFSGSFIEGNAARVRGGGIYALTDSVVTLSGSSVLDNAAHDLGGGALVADSGAGSAIVSEGTDWGMGPLDNEPEDVAIFREGATGGAEAFDGYGEDASFTCSTETLTCEQVGS